MATVFEGATADDLWYQATHRLLNPQETTSQDGRGGRTHELLHTMFVLTDPRQRWIANRQPPINPAFAIAEVIWMMRGRNDAAFLNFWNAQLPKFAGTTATYHGAYGYRLRHHFGLDQLFYAYDTLRHNSDSRQVVLQIWDANQDLPTEHGSARSPDIPCNVASLLKVRDNKLEWLQIMRSNDIFRGVPYNFVQWTSIQEILAGWLALELGTYTHISDSLHVYQKDIDCMGYASEPSHHRNEDNLAVSKETSDRIFLVLEQASETMMEKSLSQKQLQELVKGTKKILPTSYQNLLIVLACEVARKRKWPRLAHDLSIECSNPILAHLWTRWDCRI